MNLTPNDTPIQTLNPGYLMELQAAFGALIMRDPDMVRLINNNAPVLFATALFTAMSDFQVSDDGESVEAKNSALEAEREAIGMIRSVAAAFGVAEGDLTIEPSDSTVDADTEIEAVS